MNESFREWLRQNCTKKQMEQALAYHHANSILIDDFIFSCEEIVQLWVAEQCRAVLGEIK